MGRSFEELSKIYSAVYQLLKSSIISPATRKQAKKLLVDLDADIAADLQSRVVPLPSPPSETVVNKPVDDVPKKKPKDLAAS